MILDMYQYFKNNPQYFKLVGRDYMIIEYKCPIESEKLQLFTEVNFITYIISGKKDWITFGIFITLSLIQLGMLA